MEQEHRLAALFRWEAYAGLMMPAVQAAIDQAERDRADYGLRYIEKDEAGYVVYNPYRLCRFLVEVCGFTLRESYDILASDDFVGFHGGIIDDSDAAVLKAGAKMVAGTGNVLECLWLAQFYGQMKTKRDEPDAAAGWAKLAALIEDRPFVPLRTAAENWQ